MLAIAGCSSTAAPSNPSGASASVTQTAPSVWSPPATTSTSASAGSGSGTAGTDAPPSTLPGLSAACTAAIRAQAAVNELFAKALKGSSTASTAAAGSPPAAPATTTGTVPVTGGSAAALTKDDVAHTFTEVTAIIPPALTAPFSALHAAANKITATPKQDIPDVLATSSVTGAMNKITDYITKCQPPTTD